ncbi:DUF6376 family protein [Bacillus tuaregi]|uniref:DUF6376 family protein n=1 Tax=Bacillus tuaregi TaxID=1816695 RepID=UPI0008F820DA|nr:DUF6376 family protein [Bacillus tuaregi]
MRKLISVITISCLLFLSGCSLISEVNSTVEYANEATEYMNTVKDFSSQIPTLAKEAVVDASAMESLESELQSMKDEIERFNEMEPPSIATEIHSQIVSSNTKLSEGIDVYLTNVENGTLNPDILEDTGLLTTITEITSLMENIEQLIN